MVSSNVKRARRCVFLLAAAWGATLGAAQASPLDAPPDTVNDDSVVDQDAPAKPTKKHKHREKTAADAAAPEPGAASSPLTMEGRFGRLQPTGRVFFRAALERHHEAVIDSVGATHVEPVDSFDLSIPSARVGLYYRAPVKWLTADVELELTHKPELKDAWLRGRFRHATVQAGQFKMPFSVIEMETIWKLPLASRGLIHTALVKELQVAGRRPGFAFELRGRGKVRPSLTVGGFQGSVLVDDDPDKRDVDLLSRQSLSSQSWVARAELKLYDFVFGAEYEDRLGTPALLVTKYYQTGGADLTLDTELGRTGLRIWAEGIVGQSWLENRYKPPDGRDAIFVAGRLITALRFLARKKGDFYIEPYGMLGVLDPDTEVSADFAVEEVLGVNVGLWRLVRLGLEGQADRLQRNFPQTYYFGDDPNRTALMLQAGAEF